MLPDMYHNIRKALCCIFICKRNGLFTPCKCQNQCRSSLGEASHVLFSYRIMSGTQFIRQWGRHWKRNFWLKERGLNLHSEKQCILFLCVNVVSATSSCVQLSSVQVTCSLQTLLAVARNSALCVFSCPLPFLPWRVCICCIWGSIYGRYARREVKRYYYVRTFDIYIYICMPIYNAALERTFSFSKTAAQFVKQCAEISYLWDGVESCTAV